MTLYKKLINTFYFDWSTNCKVLKNSNIQNQKKIIWK